MTTIPKKPFKTGQTDMRKFSNLWKHSQQLISPFFKLGATVAIAIFASSSQAKAATAYFFLPSSSGYSRLISDGGDSFWGTFEFPNNIANGTEIDDTSGSNATINYTGKPNGSGGAKDDRWQSGASGTYNRWAYNNASNALWFYTTSKSDSLMITLENGLVGSGGWMKITNIKWCQNDTPTGSNQSSSCSGVTNTWGALTGGGIAYVRVPSPALYLGLIPFALLGATRKKTAKSKCTKDNLSWRHRSTNGIGANRT